MRVVIARDVRVWRNGSGIVWGRSAGWRTESTDATLDMNNRNKEGETMGHDLGRVAARAVAVIATSACGLMLGVAPAQAVNDKNLSGLEGTGSSSAVSREQLPNGSSFNTVGKTIGNQKVSQAADTSKDAMPENPSQKLPDKVSATVPDDATVVSKDLAVTKDGQVKNLETGQVVTDPKLVGTKDKQPDPLAKTNGKRFIPVGANEVKQAVEQNGGDAHAGGDSESSAAFNSSNNGTSGSTAGSSNANAGSSSAGVGSDADNGKSGQPNSQTSQSPTSQQSGAAGKGSVHNAALTNGDYGAYWGNYNGTQAFFQGDYAHTLFAQQAKGVVDVSEHQGTIDWQTAKNNGVEGAIIRIGFGWNNRYDGQALRNISECKRLGIPFGIYFYSYAAAPSEGASEGADLVGKLRGAGVNPSDLSYPIFYDLEYWTDSGRVPTSDPGTYDGIVNSWYSQLQGAGFNDLAVYSYGGYLQGPLNTSDIYSKTRWVASYGSRPGVYSGGNWWVFPFSTNSRGWQYADNGNIPGIGNVDLNAFGNLNHANDGMGMANVIEITQYPTVNLPNGKYYISSSANDSLGIDIPNGSAGNGVPIHFYQANRSLAQQFVFTRQSDGSYEIRNVKTNQVLDVQNGSPNSGTIVQQYTANNSTAQHWFIRDTGRGGLLLQSALGNFVMDMSNGNAVSGTQVQIFAPNLTNAQRYLISSVIPSFTDKAKRIALADSSGMTVDISNASVDRGARVQLYSWNGSLAQKFYFYEVGNSIYEIVNVNSNKALDVQNASSNNGTPIQQFDINHSMAQRWMIRDQGRAAYSLFSELSNKVIDVQGGALVNQTGLWLYDYNGSAAQQWKIEDIKSQREILNDFAANHRNELADGIYTVQSKNKASMVLDVTQASTSAGTRIQLYTSNGTGAQQWRVSHDSDGYITLTNVNSGLALDVWNAQAASCTPIQQYTSNNSWAQKWIAVRQGDGYKFVSALNSSFVLDAWNGGVVNGTPIQIYADNGSGSQRWIFSRE